MGLRPAGGLDFGFGIWVSTATLRDFGFGRGADEAGFVEGVEWIAGVVEVFVVEVFFVIVEGGGAGLEWVGVEVAFVGGGAGCFGWVAG